MDKEVIVFPRLEVRDWFPSTRAGQASVELSGCAHHRGVTWSSQHGRSQPQEPSGL